MVRSFVRRIISCGNTQAFCVNMDASAVLHNLLDQNSTKRVEVLIVMRKLIRNSNNNLPFRNMPRTSVFEIFSHVLDDVRWEVRYQCLLLISAVIQNSEDEIDSCMLVIMPNIISNLGHENANIRRASLQVLHLHMKYTNNLQNFLKVFIQHGLESPEYVTRKGCVISIGILFTREFANENLSPLVESLAKQFVHGDASLFYPIFLALQKINELVGPTTFELYFQRLDEDAVNTYKRVLSKFYFSDSCLSSSSGSHSSFTGNLNEPCSYDNRIVKYDFGIFEPEMLEEIKSDDWKVRIEGIEHMKQVMKQMPDLCEQLSDMDKFLVFLASLLNDSNFKIVNLTLSIYDLLIDKFRKEIKRFLKTFVSAVGKHLGDAKLVVREHAIKVVHKLMHHVKPSDVLANLLENKAHRNPRLREEIVNRVTAAVLTFPSYSIEFSVLCEAVSPLLIDTRRRVRLAALECFAVLAQAMGPMRSRPLVAAVDTIELNFDGEGLLGAVQARLARRILPKCTEDGSVTYAVSIPSSAGNQNRTAVSFGADIDWIMAASGSSSSSTPPSRSKESQSIEPSVLFSKTKVIKSRSDDLIHVIKTDEERFPSSDEDCNIHVVYRNIMDSANCRRKSLYDNRIVKAEAPTVFKHMKGSSSLGQSLLPNRMKFSTDCPKTRPIIAGSKIPVLARNSVHRSSADEESVSFMKPLTRTVSSSPLPEPATPPSPQHRFVQNSPSRRTLFNQSETEDDNLTDDNIVLRKISPSGSAVGSKRILVRSPSLSQLQHLPNWDTNSSTQSSSSSSFEKCCAPINGMGNIGSYFRSTPGEIIVAQPAPIHLDNVSDINAIVLHDHVKVPSSPSPKSWPSTELFHLSSSDGCKTTGRQSPVTDMPNVYSVRRNSHFSAPPTINKDRSSPSLNGMDTSSLSISKITREKMLKRQQEILKEADERRAVRERSQQEHKQLLEKRLHEEKKRQMCQQNSESFESERTESPDDNAECTIAAENPVTHGSHESLIETLDTKPSTPPMIPKTPPAKPSTPPLKPSTPTSKPSTPPPIMVLENSLKKRAESAANKGSANALARSSSLKTSSASKRIIQLAQPSVRNLGQMSKRNLAASSLTLFDDVQNGLSPYPNPDEALKKALKSLSTDTWMGKIEGIQTISRLSQLHPNVLLPHLHAVVLALLAEVKNLRSSVSRSAILAVGELFSSLKRNMEQDLDLICSTLLSKSGETVGFIRDDIDKVMKLLLEAVTPNKAALSIIAGGASHRNGAVRKTAAHSLLGVVDKMKPARVLTAKDVTERLFPITAQFLMDGMPLTRYYGRRIFELLMTHPSFDKFLLKYVQPSTLRNISSILDSVRKKGAGDMPKEKVSARTHKLNLRQTSLLNRTM